MNYTKSVWVFVVLLNRAPTFKEQYAISQSYIIGQN